MTGVQNILDERSKTHGEYCHHANMAQSLKIQMRAGVNYPELSNIQRETLDMIAHKIGRILAGDPDFEDHWRDIEGYAKLVADRIDK